MSALDRQSLGEITLVQAILPIATYFFVVWSVAGLSVICHTRAPCLNHSTDLFAISQVHFWSPWIQCHCVRCGFLTVQERRDSGVEISLLQSKHTVGVTTAT